MIKPKLQNPRFYLTDAFSSKITNFLDLLLIQHVDHFANSKNGCPLQSVLTTHRKAQFINTGVAGSLQAQIDIGDIVISSDALYHDMDVTALGYPLGEVPQLGTLEFKADEKLIALAKSSCEEVNPDIHVFTGRIVSGDQFISSKEVKNRIIDNFHGLCTEMEGAAIAHAAFLNQIPFVIIRAIVNNLEQCCD